jgi:hypothetical protein
MGFAKAHLRQAFALVVIAHGLAHTVQERRMMLQIKSPAERGTV